MNIQEEIKEIRGRLDKLEQEVTSQNNDYELYLRVDDSNNLLIEFINRKFESCTEVLIIGEIKENGECGFLNFKERKENYKKWVSAGQKIRENNEVEWRGKTYYIDNEGYLAQTNGCTDEDIYNFKDAKPCKDCEDDNILRYSHNNTPILF